MSDEPPPADVQEYNVGPMHEHALELSLELFQAATAAWNVKAEPVMREQREILTSQYKRLVRILEDMGHAVPEGSRVYVEGKKIVVNSPAKDPEPEMAEASA